MNIKYPLITGLVVLLVVSIPCKSVSQDLMDDQPKPHIVFLINEDPNNYEAHKTIPAFAEKLRTGDDFQTTVIQAEGKLPAIRFPGLDILSEADLLVVFFRRAALPVNQLNAIKNYLDEGKPLIGIRTANHAFAVRKKDEKIPEGYQDWPEFVPEILGQENQGYGSVADGTAVAVASQAAGHSILEGIPKKWQSPGNIYRAKLLDDGATLLLIGSSGGDNREPIAYTRTAGQSRVFYNSLGYPADFDMPQYRKLLVNGIRWALGMDYWFMLQE